MSTSIEIVNAKTHNLKGVDLKIPHNCLTVITGVSGSGKSSLAIDTLYAEGQRQYIESLSTYARQFLNQLQRPDVEVIEGLQPTLCIDQKVGATNPRSTVATVTEVYDYLRLLMARVGTPSCYSCGKPIVQQSADQIVAELLSLPERTKLVLMSPVVRGRRGTHRQELSEIRKAGLVRVRVNGEMMELDEVPELAQRKNHTIEAVVDKIIIRDGCDERLTGSIEVALRLAQGLVSVSYLKPDEASESDDWNERLFSTLYSCPDCGVSYEEVEPRTFSFNSPYGACPACDGVGTQEQFDPNRIVANWNKSGKSGAFSWLKELPAKLKRVAKSALTEVLEANELKWDTSLGELTKSKQNRLTAGTAKTAGFVDALQQVYERLDEDEQCEFSDLREKLPCVECSGARLRKEALSVRVDGKNIFDICSINITNAFRWLESYQFETSKREIAEPIVNEMLHRLRFLDKVGVGYLTLARAADTLSGGELQRVRLATSIGSGLVGVSYILDEPSIGLHQRDNDRLIESLRDLQKQGNTVIVVEHDESMMRAADLLVDVGPGAGTKGGHIIASDKPKLVERSKNSVTAAFLRGEETMERNSALRKPTKGQWIHLKGASLNNLQQVNVSVPLGLLVGVTGVSGSGKSSLISSTLVPALLNAIQQAAPRTGPFKSLRGDDLIDKLIEITQAPIGRSPRSTPATYTGLWDLIRNVWANTRDAKQRGYTLSRFSFNAGSGRCGHCQGQGQEKIEMNFLPDIYVRCSICGGRRFNRQTLQVRYREKTISDILDLSVDEACEFFENFSKIHQILSSLQKVGLGYITLGQSSSTLSGGEAQRIKLATELAKRETGKTIYFLDEPTTGLHFADVRRLIGVLDGLVERGNTVIVIEHNLDVVRACDWIIDMGPDGGDKGGQLIAAGTPEEIKAEPKSLTGRYI